MATPTTKRQIFLDGVADESAPLTITEPTDDSASHVTPHQTMTDITMEEAPANPDPEASKGSTASTVGSPKGLKTLSAKPLEAKKAVGKGMLSNSVWNLSTPPQAAFSFTPAQNPARPGSKPGVELLESAYKLAARAASLNPSFSEAPIFLRGLLDGKSTSSFEALHKKLDQLLEKGLDKEGKEGKGAAKLSYAAALAGKPTSPSLKGPSKGSKEPIKASKEPTKASKEPEKAPKKPESEWQLVSSKKKKKIEKNKKDEKNTNNEKNNKNGKNNKTEKNKKKAKPSTKPTAKLTAKPKGVVLSGRITGGNPLTVRDTVNKALGYVAVLGVTLSFKGNLVLLPKPNLEPGKALEKTEDQWLPALRALPGLGEAVVTPQDQWLKLVAHGVPTRPFVKGIGLDEDLFKSEARIFNSIEIVGRPRWLANPDGKLAGSVAFAITDEKAYKAALLKGLYIAGVKVTVQPLKAFSDKTQCFKCQGYAHNPASCRKRACRICGENHYTKDHRCSSCLSNGNCPHITVRCVNCGGGHTANNPNCEVRATLGISPRNGSTTPTTTSTGSNKRPRTEGPSNFATSSW